MLEWEQNRLYRVGVLGVCSTGQVGLGDGANWANVLEGLTESRRHEEEEEAGLGRSKEQVCSFCVAKPTSHHCAPRSSAPPTTQSLS